MPKSSDSRLTRFEDMFSLEFPRFYGKEGENGRDFLDSLELSCILAGKDDHAFLLKLFPLALKEGAREWYYGIDKSVKEDWCALKGAFLDKYCPKESMEQIWKKLQQLRQETIGDYDSYEGNFLHALVQLEAVWDCSHHMPDMLVKEAFMNGLFHTLQDKVRSRVPSTFREALQVAREKHRKLMYSLGVVVDYSFRIEASPCMVRMLGNPPASSAQSTSKVSSPPQVVEECVKECVKEIVFEAVDATSTQVDFQREHESEKEEESMIEESVGTVWACQQV